MKGKLTKILNVIVDILVVCVLIVSVLILTMVFTSRGDQGVPNVFGKAPITVLSDSMKGDKDDNFEKGDLLLCDVVNDVASAKYEVGDIVTFKLNGVDIDNDGADDYITHRIYKVNKNGTYQTKGDNNTTYDQDPNADGWGDISSMSIVAVYKGAKISGFGNFVAYIQTGTGFFLIILLPMIIFFLYQAVRVVINVIVYNKEKALKKAQEAISNSDLTEEQKQKAIEEYLAQQTAKGEAETKVEGEQSGAVEEKVESDDKV